MADQNRQHDEGLAILFTLWLFVTSSQQRYRLAVQWQVPALLQPQMVRIGRLWLRGEHKTGQKSWFVGQFLPHNLAHILAPTFAFERGKRNPHRFDANPLLMSLSLK